ncbi:hypothetical protein UB43_22070 [Pseudomonas sp. 21]|uniref:hypothetical protein n=1 Tax=unclassified Pseudomonas TaxID=196821 RepID=UPI0005EADC54|nr:MULTISPECIES: hypothetical protein [unclassified Pseudomonas]KJJ96571.1 hypothetical protein UB43_22070 [Pseudomonas sp. 21]MBV7583729.1 hypothetical protein [Pseudomonas sp. PDM33]
MDAFDVRGGLLLAADVPASAIAERPGTPPGEAGDIPAGFVLPPAKKVACWPFIRPAPMVSS